MVRIPYVNKFEAFVDLPFWVSHTMLCSIIETGIGCICSSVPSLRHLLRSGGSEGSSGPSNKRSLPLNSDNVFTVGSQPRKLQTDGGLGLSGLPRGRKEVWEELEDGASDQSDSPFASNEARKGPTSAFDFELKDMPKKQSVYQKSVYQNTNRGSS